MADEELKLLTEKIVRILEDAKSSHAIHIRKLKELSSIRSSSSSSSFFEAFSKALTPLFNFQRRTASAERVIKFVAVFVTTRGEGVKNGSEFDAFFEEFLRFLLVAAVAAIKTVRFRACQMISEIIMRLPDDTEVSDELWDEVIECMKLRVGDKIPAVRTFAVRALSRFANDVENSDILELFLQTLPLEQNSDVRKAIVLSLPPSNATSAAIIDCTLDVSQSVRKAAYCVLANKFPLQSLSIKLRTLILQRGLSDRSTAVTKECLKLLKDEWLLKCCNGDPIELLKFLDVETYEMVGESVMGALLKAGLVKVQDGQSIRQFLASTSDTTEGQHQHSIQLMEAEVALYWRTVCSHLQMEAQAKGSDAAMTMGTESAVYAAEASDNNDLLDKILPASISEYVELVKAHISAGPNYNFASRQLLLLGALLDFSDSTNRKVASEFVQEWLHRPLDNELDDTGNKIVIGDGISLGGDKDWASAVSELAKKVHATPGEFEKVILSVVEELAQPCRERTADVMQWLHCLSVTGLLLENSVSFRWMQGKVIQPAEILHSLLIPGAKHAHLDVQRASIRCLGLFGLLERNPSEDLTKQLRLSFVRGPCSIAKMACKALLDLGMWHGPLEVDKAMNQNLSSNLQDHRVAMPPVRLSDADEDLSIELLDLLFAGFDRHDWDEYAEADDNESLRAVLGEGFAKMLLLSEKYPSTHVLSNPLLLAKLISLYFCNESKEHQRLKQCLSVFFETYPCISANHKKCLSKAFVLVMRSMWPGINGNASGSSVMISNMRKRAVQASRFMLHMMQTPLFRKETSPAAENGSENLDGLADQTPDFESREEGLAIRIAVEVARSPAKKTAAEKSYVAALSRILVLIHFRPSEQGAIKLMRQLLTRVVESVAAEKDILKELKQMGECLKAVDIHPDQNLSSEQADLLLGRLEEEFKLDHEEATEVAPTPAPRSTRPTRARRRTRKEEESSSDGEVSPTSVVPTNPGVTSVRSQRASKTAAMSKMTTAQKTIITEDESEEDGHDEEGSEVTSEDGSDGFE